MGPQSLFLSQEKPREGLSYICQGGKVRSLICWVCLDGPEATEAKHESLKDLLVSRAPWVDITIGALWGKRCRSKAILSSAPEQAPSMWLCKTPLNRHRPPHPGVLSHPESRGPASLSSPSPLFSGAARLWRWEGWISVASLS